MTKSNSDMVDIELENLFAQARATPPQIPDGLMARVVADAENMQPTPARKSWQDWLRAIGGAPGLGGLVTASVFGFWLGVSPPENLPDLAGQVLGQDYSAEYDLTLDTTTDLTGFGWDIDEG
ncbi:MAG: hypothetical protein WA790_08720 [Sulfitobacter sp.]